MEGKELQIMPRFVVEPLSNVWIEKFARLFRGDQFIPVGFHILHLQLIGSAGNEPPNEKQLFVPDWGAV